jgi:hypothetical protein
LLTSAFRTARARYAALTRSRPENDSELRASRQLMREQKLFDAIEGALNQASPLSNEARQQVQALLSSPEVRPRD